MGIYCAIISIVINGFLADFEHLKCKSAENTFRGIHLSFYKIPKPSSIILKNIKKDLLDEAYLKYHFEKYAGRDSIESIKLTGSKAFIKFCNHECKLSFNIFLNSIIYIIVYEN